MKNSIKFIANVAIGGKYKGEIFTLLCDETNAPIDSYWRRRYKDSKIDNCISILNQEPSVKISLKKEEKEEKPKKDQKKGDEQ